MRKPTDKQFAKAHPELAGKRVEIKKHYNGVTVYVQIVEDLEFDERGRVTKAAEARYILNEQLELTPCGGVTYNLHTYVIGPYTGMCVTYSMGGNDPTVYEHMTTA